MPKLAAVSMEQPVQASPEATARSKEAATSAAAVGDVVPPVGSTQLGHKVTVAQAMAAPRAEEADYQQKRGQQVVSNELHCALALSTPTLPSLQLN